MHLVLSSAGPYGLIQLGMLSALALDKPESVRGTSAGSFIAVLLSIGIPIDEIIEYIIKRPLHKWFKVDLTLYAVISANCFTELLSPLFHAYDVPLDITMKQLYERSKIDIYLYTTSVTELTPVELHHNSHPDLQVITAIAMSSSIPFMFPPVFYNGEYYIDGGILTHCPPSTEDSIVLCMKHQAPLDMSSPFTLAHHLVFRALNKLNTYPVLGKIYMYEINTQINADFWSEFLNQESKRVEMIEIGKSFILKQYENKEG